jgi:hypothetical protein
MVRKASIKPMVTTEDIDEGSSEGIDENDVCRASFEIHDGQRMLRVQALKDCWAIQFWATNTNQKTGEDESGWRSFKYVTDLGSAAGKIFDFRLKNSEAKTLEDLSIMAKTIRSEIRREFRLQ